MAIMVLVTIPEKNAAKLAKIVLKTKTCACVNIITKVKSFFWWQGKIDNAKEALLIFKTKNILFDKLKDIVKQNHPYEIPEIVAFKISNLNKEYLAWLNKETNAV